MNSIKPRRIFVALSVALLFVFSLPSCMEDLQDDVKIDPVPIPEGIKLGSVELGVKYTNQAYYNLAENKVVHTNTIYDWDLAFECAPEGWHIQLCSSRFMHAANTGNKNFDEVNSTSGWEMNFDPSTGNLDSTAVGRWFEVSANDTIYHNQVYVVDLGLTENGEPLGYKKVVFMDLSNGVYTFKHANLDGSDETISSVQVDERFNFIGFSFSNGGKLVNFEAEKENYDLFFGQYTTLLYSGTDPYPYIVRGALSNRNGVQATLLSGEKLFADVEYADVADLIFPDVLDGIGHEWKYYNLEEGYYAVELDNIYIIRDASSNYYKLHFLSYFNTEGQNGYPQFEFKKLIP